MLDNEIYLSGGSDFCLQTFQLSVAPVILFYHGADQSESRKERERGRERERERDGRKVEVKKNRPFKLFLRGRLSDRGCCERRIEWQLWELLKSAVYHRVLGDGCVSSRTTEARPRKTHPSPSLAEGHGAALAANPPREFTLYSEAQPDVIQLGLDYV